MTYVETLDKMSLRDVSGTRTTMRAMRITLPITFRAPTVDEESMIRSWSWEDAPMESALVGLHDHDDFIALDATGEVVGYCSFGPHAMIPARFNDPDYADVAWGIRPDLVGCGNGATFIEEIVRHGSSLYVGRRVRAQIRASNPRSLRAAIRAGFEERERIAKRVIVVYPMHLVRHHGSRRARGTRGDA